MRYQAHTRLVTGGLAVAAALLFSAGCHSASTHVLGPSGTKCAISVPTSLPSIGPGGGSGTITVTAAPECVWSASSGTDWISLTSGASGQGTGAIQFAAAANPGGSTRYGAVLVEDARVPLSQAGLPCQVTLAPASQAVGAGGGDGGFTVESAQGCGWSATARASWLSVVGAADGAGTARVRFRAAPNNGPARSGAIAVGNRTFIVVQAAVGSPLPPPGVPPGTPPDAPPGGTPPDAPPGTLPDAPVCTLALSAAGRLVPAAGGTDTVAVTGSGDCPWVAASGAPWIVVTAGATGRGPGDVTLTIDPNGGSQRVGLVTVAGYVYTVTQAAAAPAPPPPPPPPCTYDVTPATQSVSLLGGSFQVTVRTQSACGWTATTAEGWIQFTSDASGTGNGVLAYRVPLVSLGLLFSRSGTINIAGHTVTVDQHALLLNGR